MSFTKPGPISGYVTGDLIDEADINYWCSALPDCVDGAGGGTYTLAAPLIFNGDDLQIGEDLDVGGDLAITGDTTLIGGLTVTGSVVFNNYLQIGSSSSDTCDVVSDITFRGPVTIGDASSDLLHVNSTTTFNNNVTVGSSAADTLTVASNTTVNGTLTATAATALAATTFRFSASVAADADKTVTAADCGQVYFIETNAADRAWTASGTFTIGDWILVKHRASGGHTVTVLGTGLTIGKALLLINNGTTWRSFALSENFA